jgi:hypothetical protein
MPLTLKLTMPAAAELQAEAAELGIKLVPTEDRRFEPGGIVNRNGR